MASVLPVIDLSSSDRISTAHSIRQAHGFVFVASFEYFPAGHPSQYYSHMSTLNCQFLRTPPAVDHKTRCVIACIDYGFFYLINHGVDELVLQNAFEQSKMFFSLPLEDKMKSSRNVAADFGFSPLYAENLDPSSKTKGGIVYISFTSSFLQCDIMGIDYMYKQGIRKNLSVSVLYKINLTSDLPKVRTSTLSATFYIIRKLLLASLNAADLLPSWRSAMENYYTSLLSTGKKLSSLIALALNLDEHFFHSIGALDKPYAFLRLLHYPGEMGDSDEDGVVYGASAHSDYGMITLLATDGVPGLQVCREKHKQPRTWENVNHVKGAYIVNLGDMMERWTNCLFRSPLHRVMPTGKERYSMAFFLDPNPDCMVECLKSCCSESSPPRFPPIRCGDYLRDRINAAYSS